MSRPMLQSMSSKISRQITALEYDLSFARVLAKQLYKVCDKNDPYTHETFKSLNQARDNVRKLKKDISSLSEVSRILKKQLRGTK